MIRIFWAAAAFGLLLPAEGSIHAAGRMPVEAGAAAVSPGVPITRFLPERRTPAGVQAALQRASEYSSRHGVPIVFGPGTLETGGTVRLRQGTHFVGTGGVVRRAADARGAYIFEIHEGDITVEGLKIDFNGGGAYTAGFAIRSGGVRGLTFDRLHLFDSDEPDPRENYGDRWGVLVAPVEGPRSPVEDLRVTNSLAENGIQLTAGYGNRGLRGAWITNNRVVEAEENGIALVLAGGPGGLEDIHILDNEIVGPRGVGIFIGVDRDTQAGTFVRRVVVERNRIVGFTYPRRGNFGILFRAAELGNEEIVIRDNVVDGRGSRNSVGLRLQAKKQENPNLPAGKVRFFDAPVIENNRFRSVSPAIDLWYTIGGVVRGNQGAMPRFIELRSNSRGVRLTGNRNGE